MNGTQKELIKALINIEVQLAKIEVHLSELKADVKKQETDLLVMEEKVSKLETFKDKMMGASIVLVPIIAFVSAIGHDIIKRFMGW